MICISSSKSRRAIFLVLRLFSGSVTTHSSGVKQHETTLREKEKKNDPVAYTWETQKLIICMYVCIYISYLYIYDIYIQLYHILWYIYIYIIVRWYIYIDIYTTRIGKNGNLNFSLHGQMGTRTYKGPLVICPLFPLPMMFTLGKQNDDELSSGLRIIYNKSKYIHTLSYIYIYYYILHNLYM